MKTSYILLAVIAFITLTGMVATDVLLKQQYDKLDWSNPYQSFEQRTLPVAKHVIIEGAPVAEIIVEKSTKRAQTLLLPSMANSYKCRKSGDTLFVSYTMNYDGQSRDPHYDIDRTLPAGMILRLPDLRSLRITNGRLTVNDFTTEQLVISLQNSRLFTNKLAVSNAFSLTAGQNSFAVLGADYYRTLAAVVNDSSGIKIVDSQVDAFKSQLSPKAEIQLKGQSLKWLK